MMGMKIDPPISMDTTTAVLQAIASEDLDLVELALRLNARFLPGEIYDAWMEGDWEKVRALACLYMLTGENLLD